MSIAQLFGLLALILVVAAVWLVANGKGRDARVAAAGAIAAGLVGILAYFTGSG